jgi:hypothetical protein
MSDRPARAAKTACKRKLHEMLSTRRPRAAARSPPAQLTILNDHDAITLDPIRAGDPGTFVAPTEGGRTAYVHDAVELFKFCAQSIIPPRDPNTLREFTDAECGQLEAAAGQPAGELARLRSGVTKQRRAEEAEDANQVAFLHEVTALYSVAVEEALQCQSAGDVVVFAGFMHAEFSPALDSLLVHLEMCQPNITALMNMLQPIMRTTERLAPTNPGLCASLVLLTDIGVERLRARLLQT